jgi:hypothetical protein
MHEPFRENERGELSEKSQIQRNKNKFLSVYKHSSFYNDNPFQNERLKSPNKRSASQHRANRISP